MNRGDAEVLGLGNLGLWLSAGTPGEAAADGEESPGLVPALPLPQYQILQMLKSLSWSSKPTDMKPVDTES